VLVVDNNSIDNTQELVEGYIREHTDFNIAYVTESRQGASFARNTGAALQKGSCFALWMMMPLPNRTFWNGF
jgi:glycosyltransferase involved in cell wall biosynthesis